MSSSHMIPAITLFAAIVILSANSEEVFARGGGGRGGGGGRPSGGGGTARPAGGGGPARPPGGAANGPNINRSPGVSAPSVQRPSVQPGQGARGGPGIMTSPRVSPGTRPSIGAGTRPAIDGKLGSGTGINSGIGNGGIAAKGGVGNKPNVGAGNFPAYGDRPGGRQPLANLPGLGVSVGAGLAAGRAADNLGRRQELAQNRQQNIGDRSQNLEDRLQQRQDFRQQNQSERQNYRNDRREDWQNWHDDYYGHHNGWYHGAWCDHWGDAWSHMWSEHTAAMVLGTTMWGLNRMSYWFGTSSYANPYYSEPLVVDNAIISYAEPLAAPPASQEAPTTASAELPPGVTSEGMKQFEAAQTAFLAGDYQRALAAVNRALASMPKDAVIHEFRALVLFALGKYHDAAETLHPVLAVGPGWDWTTMSSLYPDADTYTKQLRALEAFAGANPNSAEARFVLAYHYLVLGHEDAAAKQLQKVRQSIPTDPVSNQLLQMTGKSKATPAPAAEGDAKIDGAELIGGWTANRDDKARFELTLSKDKSFTWVYREGKKEQQVKGAYAIDGNVLALEPDAGGVMLAEVSPPQNGMFEFRTVGASQTDPPLKFRRK